jgi:hypothetical protein
MCARTAVRQVVKLARLKGPSITGRKQHQCIFIQRNETSICILYFQLPFLRLLKSITFYQMLFHRRQYSRQPKSTKFICRPNHRLCLNPEPSFNECLAIHYRNLRFVAMQVVIGKGHQLLYRAIASCITPALTNP